MIKGLLILVCSFLISTALCQKKNHFSYEIGMGLNSSIKRVPIQSEGTNLAITADLALNRSFLNDKFRLGGAFGFFYYQRNFDRKVLSFEEFINKTIPNPQFIKYTINMEYSLNNTITAGLNAGLGNISLINKGEFIVYSDPSLPYKAEAANLTKIRKDNNLGYTFEPYFQYEFKKINGLVFDNTTSRFYLRLSYKFFEEDVKIKYERTFDTKEVKTGIINQAFRINSIQLHLGLRTYKLQKS